jgi:cytosine/adenosine deaminase-related metal-dependent hydrolase
VAVVVRDGRLAATDAPCDAWFDLGPGTLRPALINAHDHLHRNHYPRLGSPPYTDAYAWGTDLHRRFQPELARARSLPREQALLFGALKNLLGGAATVVHHDAWEPTFENAFPVRVARVGVAHSLRLTPRLQDVARAGRLEAPGPAPPLCVHLAEGTNAEAAAEVREASAEGLLGSGVLAVHLVGVAEQDIATLERAGTGVVWCPSSNAFLLGRTAPHRLFEARVDVLLGTDALLTGQGTLLDELRTARRLRYLTEERLNASVGGTAAARLGLTVPELAEGARADLLMLRRPLPDARPRDVGLVMVGGRPVYGDAEYEDLFALSGVRTEPLLVGGVPKRVVWPLATVVARVGELFREPLRILD